MNCKHIGMTFCFTLLISVFCMGNVQAQGRLTQNLCQSEDREVTCRRGVCDPATGNCVQCLTDMDCIAGQCNLSTHECKSPYGCIGQGCGTPSPGILPTPFWRPPRPPVIIIQQKQEPETEPTITNYRIDAKVNGLYAVVSTEFTIYNPNHRVLEGELEFPLPDDAVVSGYAIDVNGVLTDAQVVEKKKARIAFENEVKKGIDPGLVEQIKGNEYRTRIYPIPAQGGRRIRVDYTTPLISSPRGDVALALPMPNTKLSKRDITITVVAQNMPAPAVGGLGDKRFLAAQAAWIVESHDTDITPKENVIVAMPNLPNVVTAVENFNGDHFFMASVKTPNPINTTISMPSKWRIIWDASTSRTPPDIQQARQLLEALPENASYELHVFRNILESPLTFSTRSRLLQAIDALEYDGGTDFSCLNNLASKPFDGPTLFFTDGMDTMTEALPQFGIKSVALISGSARDISAMRKICGGRIINLDIINGQDAIQQILSPAPVVSSFKGNGFSNIEGIGLASSGRTTILGRVQGAGNKGTIQFSDGQTIEVDFSHNSITNGKTLANAWATRRVDDLSPRAEDNRDELLAIGRKFSIVSPVSSMIVLENLNQWIEYDIEPPETLVDIHQQWLAKRKSDADKEQENEKNKARWLENLKNDWKDRITWWNNPIPPKPEHGKSLMSDDDLESRPVRAASANQDHDLGSKSLSRSSPQPKIRMKNPSPSASSNVGAKRPRRETTANRRNTTTTQNTDDNNIDGAITVKKWDPNTPYLQRIKDTYNVYKTVDSLYAEYIKQKIEYGNSPAFYLDCANLFYNENQPKLALRILSNLSELKIDDVSLLRVYAWRLREAGDYDNAIIILRKVAKIRPDEAISWRDLALTLTMRGKEKKNVDDIQEALELFHKTAFTPWNNEGKRSDARWTAIIALEEFNELVAWSKRQKWSKAPTIPNVDSVFLKNLDMDMRIMMTWDADSTDIDMHVVEPSGEEVYYSHKRSESGGMISHDVTTGYGPEEFLHKKAPKGNYSVSTKYFASHQQSLIGPATITVTFYTNWGRSNQTSKTMSLRLEKAKEIVEVGEYELK